MIQVTEVLVIHDILIERFGGVKGIRDKAALDSAINRPYQTFDGQELYPEAVDKAAAIFESIILNQPFIDGICSYEVVTQARDVGHYSK